MAQPNSKDAVHSVLTMNRQVKGRGKKREREGGKEERRRETINVFCMS